MRGCLGMIFSKRNNQQKTALSVDEDPPNVIVERYETIDSILTIPACGIIFFAWYSDFKTIDLSFMYPAAGAAAMLALLIFVGVGLASVRKYNRLPFTREYWKAGFGTLALFPLFAISFILLTNVYLDKSLTRVRETVIVDKKEAVSSKGRHSYDICVRSWRTDMDIILIDVHPEEFAKMKIGDPMKVNTKEGFWKFEYIPEDK